MAVVAPSTSVDSTPSFTLLFYPMSDLRRPPRRAAPVPHLRSFEQKRGIGRIARRPLAARLRKGAASHFAASPAAMHRNGADWCGRGWVGGGENRYPLTCRVFWPSRILRRTVENEYTATTKSVPSSRLESHNCYDAHRDFTRADEKKLR